MSAVIAPRLSLQDLLVTKSLGISDPNLLAVGYRVYERRGLPEDRQDSPRVDKRQHVSRLAETPALVESVHPESQLDGDFGSLR